MNKIYLTVRNYRSLEFVGEVEDRGKSYKFTKADGSGMEVYKDMIEDLRIERNTTGVKAFGESEYRRMYEEAPKYNEYEYDKIERMR